MGPFRCAYSNVLNPDLQGNASSARSTAYVPTINKSSIYFPPRNVGSSWFTFLQPRHLLHTMAQPTACLAAHKTTNQPRTSLSDVCAASAAPIGPYFGRSGHACINNLQPGPSSRRSMHRAGQQ